MPADVKPARAGIPGRVTAAVVDHPGAVPAVQPVPLPERAAGCTLLRVVAAPLNPLDLLIASGGFHSARYEEPYIPGSECAGRVLESDVYAPGSLVYAECHASPSAPGTLSTHAVVRDEDVLPLPPDVDPALAAAVGNSGTAAFMPLIEVAGLKPGETVLVLGATGAAGQLAVQIARRHGAGRIVGVGRDEAALDHLSGLGADAVVALRPGEDQASLSGRLSAAAGQVDVILDALYGLPLEAALPACAPRARVVNIGNLAGSAAAVPAGLLRGRQITLTGFAGLFTPLRAKEAALTWLWAELGRGLRVDIRPFPLDQLAAAWAAQAGSPHAKCIVVPGDGIPVEPTLTDRSDHS